MGFFDWILDWILPRYCLGCGEEGKLVCQKCAKENIIFIDWQACPVCRKINNSGVVCEICKKNFVLDGLLVCVKRNDFLLKLVHEYKYQDLFCLDKFLVKMPYCVLDKNKINFDLITSVPLSAGRLLWRGFNQSEKIAKHLANILNCKYESMLIRAKFERPQVGLHKEERIKNVRDVFVSKKPDFAWSGKSVLIVDDLCTTAATLNECAKVLKNMGIYKVWGIVLARD